MKLYRTKDNTVINLENTTVIYKNPDPEENTYFVATVEGKIFEIPELTDEDIDHIMEYNNHFID